MFEISETIEMELSSRTTQERCEEYLVKEMMFAKRKGLFSTSDRIIAIVQLKEEEYAKIISVFSEDVFVKYSDCVEASMKLYVRIRMGEMMNALMSGPYEKKEIVKAEFDLPSGYQILGLEDEEKQEVKLKSINKIQGD